MADDPTANLRGAADAFLALERLTQQGLASNTDPRGLTNAGISTLGDLLTVARFQFGATTSPNAKVASATARAMMSALADIISDLRGEPTDSQTGQLLDEALREATL